MKILALGGSGGMGRFAVRSLINHKAVKKIYIADLNGSSAKDFASNFDDSIQNLSMGEVTSLPLACGVKMFLDGVIIQRGIHAPESGIIDPNIFINYLSKEINSDVKLKPLFTYSENNDSVL